MSSSKNIDTRKSSFLNKSNSEFIEQMYLKFIKKDPEIPQSWIDYFKDLDEESNLVIKEINGPSWQRNKKIDNNIILEKYKDLDKKTFSKKNKDNLSEDNEKSYRHSVRAVTLIRAYRTQGNLLATLDPLGLKTSKYIEYEVVQDIPFKDALKSKYLSVITKYENTVGKEKGKSL